MTLGVRVKIEGEGALMKKLKDAPLGMKMMAKREMKKIAGIYSEAFTSIIKHKNLTWNKNLLKSAAKPLPYKEGKEVGYQLSFPKYARYIDSMRPHFVSPFNPHTGPLRQWVRDKFLMGFMPNVLFVKPTPFIDSAIQKGMKETRARLKSGGLVTRFIKDLFGGA